MRTPHKGAPDRNDRNATNRERSVNAELYRAGKHAGAAREAGAIRAGLSLLIELIETRNRRASNGFFDPPHED